MYLPLFRKRNNKRVISAARSIIIHICTCPTITAILTTNVATNNDHVADDNDNNDDKNAEIMLVKSPVSSGLSWQAMTSM